MGSEAYYCEYNGVKYEYNGFHGMTLKLTQDIKHIKVLGSVEDIYGHKFDIEIISAETFMNSKAVIDVIDFQYVWGYVLVITCQVSVIANMKLWTKILRLVY